MEKITARCIRFLIRLYQYSLGLILPNSCRFEPSCSNFTIMAVNKYGVVRGLLLGCQRILKCHPWSDGGHDPV